MDKIRYRFFNMKDKKEINSIVQAVKVGDSKTLKALLEAGADVNASDEDGRTAYMQASAEVREEWQRLGLPH